MTITSSANLPYFIITEKDGGGFNAWIIEACDMPGAYIVANNLFFGDVITVLSPRVDHIADDILNALKFPKSRITS